MDNLKKEVLVRIDTVQREDGDKTSFSNEYNGTLYVKKDKYFIFYSEYGEDGEKMSDSIIRCDGECVELKRTGAYSSILSFKNNSAYKTVYSTPYGGIPVSLKCKKVVCAIDCDGGKIILDYKINITDKNYENYVTINVKCIN
ncbi:MAG: DUF1934 domain-containing protein [Clostridia bacterium]|nr:DUF1934 domain-containing protein [Clostridia bacterium]